MIGFYMLGFVVLVAGVGGLGTAVAYAIRPTESKLALMRPITLAGIFAAVCSTSAGFAVALSNAADSGVKPETMQRLLAGLAEAWVPLFVAFALLSVAWLFVALGLRRQV